jgi:hypothetical protein
MARAPKVGRNHACPCGSGKKYKQCCAGRAAAPNPWINRLMIGAVLALIAGAVAAGISSFGEHPSSTGAGPGRVWSPEHGHYH